MPSIKCTNCGAVLKTQNEIPAGKKVKCPKCSETFVVEAEEAPKPAPPPEEPEEKEEAADGEDEEQDEAPAKGKPSKADDDDEAEGASDEEEDDAPKKGKKGKKGSDEDGDKKPAKKNTTMIVGIAIGAVLLCCCLPSCGGTIWHFMFNTATNVTKDAIIRDAVKDIVIKENAPKDFMKDFMKDMKDFKK